MKVNLMQRKLILVLSILMPILCLGAGGDYAGGFHLDGSIKNMGIIWVVPFAGILLSIAILQYYSPVLSRDGSYSIIYYYSIIHL